MNNKRCRLAMHPESPTKQSPLAANGGLEANEDKFRRLLGSMIDGFVIVATDGKILECNAVYRTMLGYSQAELTRMSYVDITPEKWHAFEAEIVEGQVLKRGYSDVYEKEYRRKDGTIFPVELRSVLIRDERGNPANIWGIVRDITSRKRTEATARQRHEIVVQKGRKLNLELEAQVAERTSALQGTIAELKTQISERRRLEREILKISDYEQSRIGRDLHDGACQGLAGIAVLAEVVSRDLGLESPQAAAKTLEISRLARLTLDEIRCLAAGLVPIKVGQRGLDWALQDLADEISTRNNVRCVLTRREPITFADSDVAVQLFRIVQEATSNALHHGHAQNISIEIAKSSGTVSLIIRDDGVGLTRKQEKNGLGMHTMQYRAKMLGGFLEVRSAAKIGTVVTCSFSEKDLLHDKEKSAN